MSFTALEVDDFWVTYTEQGSAKGKDDIGCNSAWE